ncbi:putative cell wall protein [Abrus precatorius]|uniref:Cell wall protein n=1 Tax=Abrus precatorius TaxID=3816 RepID=A0A8B8KKG1_ABRPR|nr:putative cell wall protein [Abrus precatorius]
MASKACSLHALLLISTILFATTWQAVDGRHITPKNSNIQDKKEPQWMFNSDGGFFIPGFGRVGLPPFFGVTPQNPYTGGSGAGSGSAGRSYVPGGDDTFVPNPGFEVPNPGSGGGVPATVHP